MSQLIGPTLWLVLLFLVIPGCKTFEVLPNETEINKVNLERYFDIGDNVTVYTKDGEKYRFNIQAFEETKLCGSHIKIPYTLMDDIKIYQDLSLVLVGTGLAAVLLIVSLGLIF